MSSRDSARHRSTGRARTPLTDAAEAVGGGLLLARRSGAVLAVSTGLVASVGLPARATGGSPAVAEPVTSVASVGATSFSSTAFGTAPVAAAGIGGSTALTAPAMAKVTFDTSAFTAAPAPVVVAPVTPAPAERTTTRASRTTERKAITKTASGDTDDDAGSGSAAGSSVLSVAAKYVGTPYVYGGTTPSGFDCSGYTSYVFDKLGIDLPRTAAAQKNATTRVSASSAKPGDLVFFGSPAYHVGIYAGNGKMYDAPKPGKSVSKRDIWSSSVTYGRVTG